MDRRRPIAYIAAMGKQDAAATQTSQNSTQKTAAPNRGGDRVGLGSLGGLKMLFLNPGLVLDTVRHGRKVGQDEFGTLYFEERKVTRAHGRRRRWAVYPNGSREPSEVPPEWHAWLHFTTDEPIATAPRRPWQKPYIPNMTGTAAAYFPPGHDYRGGERARSTGDYEAWTPDAPAEPQPEPVPGSHETGRPLPGSEA